MLACGAEEGERRGEFGAEEALVEAQEVEAVAVWRGVPFGLGVVCGIGVGGEDGEGGAVAGAEDHGVDVLEDLPVGEFDGGF